MPVDPKNVFDDDSEYVCPYSEYDEVQEDIAVGILRLKTDTIRKMRSFFE